MMVLRPCVPAWNLCATLAFTSTSFAESTVGALLIMNTSYGVYGWQRSTVCILYRRHPLTV